MKKKILYMSQWMNDATAYYRLLPLDYIQHPDITIERKPYYGEITFSSILSYNVLILERPSSLNDLNLIKLAKSCGLKIVTDWDDDVLHIDEYNPMWSHYNGNKSVIMDCIVQSDEVWVSTEGIKKSFTWYNKNISVIPNAHNDYLQPIDKKLPFNSNAKKAIWRGGASHEADVYHYADEILKMVNDRKDWFFQFIGHRFIYLEQRCGDNYLPVSTLPLMQYFEYLYAQNPNLVFHLLVNTKFNESKSNIAWMEASYVGAAFVGNYDLPEFKRFGIIDQSQMEVAMTTNYNLLKDLNEKSWQEICDTLLLSDINKKRIESLEAI